MAASDVTALYARSVEEFLTGVRAAGAGQWTAPTPCAGWDLRALVNHVVGEDRWAVPLMAGRTMSEVADRFDGDLLGASPTEAAESAARDAVAAVAEPGAMARTVHLSFGDTPAEEYVWQLTADHLIHGWDVAAATGAARAMDDGLVAAVSDWFAAREDLYRAAGAVGARPDVRPDAPPQDRLLAGFGRSPDWTA